MRGAALEVDSGVIRAAERELVSSLCLVVPATGVLALVGPVASGKSSLITAFAGAPAPEGVERSGTWLLRSEPLSRYWESGERPPKIAWLAQPRRNGVNGRTLPHGAIDHTRWREAFEDEQTLVLADEPFRFVPESEREALKEAIATHARNAPVVLVSHDVSLIRELASRVCLLVAGRLETEVEACRFFDTPPTPLAAQFIRQGNCWPQREVEPPGHFHWIQDDSLAGMGQPGLTRDASDDYDFLIQVGITHVFTLTESSLPREELKKYGLVDRHVPIRDMGVPSIHAAAGLCRAIERSIESGGRAVVHCKAGMGRTGTILAAFLTWKGEPADAAIDSIRRIAPGYIQNREQERFIRDFATAMGGG